VDDAKFWKIISAGGKRVQDDQDEQLEAIREKLEACSPDELIEFQKLLDKRLIAAYTQELWGAGYLMNGGCSDDMFLYFRAWLISRGQKTYEAALADPDTLVKLADPERDDLELEELMYLALEVYEEAVGSEMPRAELVWPAKPSGEAWDFDDDAAMRKHLPRLAAAYLDESDD
jgi:hypothetical protein